MLFNAKKVLVPNPNKAYTKVIYNYYVKIKIFICGIVSIRLVISFTILVLSDFTLNHIKETVFNL
jgi:hypothetical protein